MKNHIWFLNVGHHFINKRRSMNKIKPFIQLKKLVQTRGVEAHSPNSSPLSTRIKTGNSTTVTKREQDVIRRKPAGLGQEEQHSGGHLAPPNPKRKATQTWNPQPPTKQLIQVTPPWIREETLLHQRRVWTPLVAQWLRICLPMQGTWVGSLIREDFTCSYAREPQHRTHMPQLLKPSCLEPAFPHKKQ